MIEPERFLVFAALFCFVPLVVLAPEPFDDFFDLRFAAFAMFPPGARMSGLRRESTRLVALT